MTDLELVLSLLAIMLILVVLARRINLADPIVLLLAGLGLAILPIWPEVELDPDIVFTVFLPPILFAAAASTSWRDFRRQFAPISFLAIGLVLATMVCIAAVAHTIIPGLNWASAFVLGAIVSPPDAVATVAIVQRIGVPRRIVTVLEGESLVNDATALVSYRFAVVAAVTGVFSFWEAGLNFVYDVAGGLLAGFVIGRLVIWALPYLGEQGGIVASFVAAFGSYLVGESIESSGVLAAVTAGLIYGRYLPVVGNAQFRLQTRAVWDQVVFIINGLVFMLIGLELQPVIEGIVDYSPGQLAWYAVAICLTAILIRIVWVFSASYLLRVMDGRVRRSRSAPTMATSAVVAWAGLRGVVTLAAALALPRVTATGAPFDDRNLIIFLAFSVIVATLLGQGLTLGPLVRRLNLVHDDTAEQEEVRARREANLAALQELDRLRAEAWTPAGLALALQAQYQRRLDRLPSVSPTPDQDGHPNPSDQFEAQRRLMHTVYNAEREAIIRLRDAGEISDEVLQTITHEIDLAETRPIRL